MRNQMDSDLISELDKCVQVLYAGGVLLCPTDTVWGLSTDVFNQAGLDRINLLKGRPGDKSFILLFADLNRVLQFYEGSLALDTLFDRYRDRPTSFVLQQMAGLPAGVCASDGSIAVRIPEHPFLRALLNAYPQPLVSTSANISSCPAPAVFSDVAQQILDGVDHAAAYGRLEQSVHPPSRLIALDENGDIRLLRD